jgi:hypothetical protein
MVSHVVVIQDGFQRFELLLPVVGDVTDPCCDIDKGAWIEMVEALTTARLLTDQTCSTENLKVF